MIDQSQLPKSIFKIYSTNNALAGVGFLINTKGIIVTCSHVVESVDCSPGDTLLIQSIETGIIGSAKILEDGWRSSKEQDLAFLTIEKISDMEDLFPVVLGTSQGINNHKFSTLGCPTFTDEDGTLAFDSGWAAGSILGKVKRPNGVSALQISSPHLDKGFSGSPILDINSKTIVGIFTDTSDGQGWATPAEYIVESYPDIKVIINKNYTNRKLEPLIVHPLNPAEHFTGRERQLRSLNNFWRKGGGGVLALVGMGGAGKTAIVSRFLYSRGWESADRSFEEPDGLLVWSFYDSPNADEFITQAYSYFSRFKPNDSFKKMARGQRANPFLLSQVLQKLNGRFLIIMDGLEKMQSTGQLNSPRGTIQAPPLKQLIRLIADGRCGQTKAIITSRFSITDLTDWAKDKYFEISVDQLELGDARSLMMKIGVHGTDEFLNQLVDKYGLHALTIDLLSRLIVEYYQGNALRARDLFNLPSLEETTGSSVVDKQARKLAQVLYTYEKKLDYKELTLLKCLSVFRRPINRKFLVDVFLGEKSPSISREISQLNSQQLMFLLHGLVDKRLVIMENGVDEDVYTCHPAVRDHFFIALIQPEETHESISRELATLVNSPGFVRPKDERSMNLLEELIYHTVACGHTADAQRIYRERLGYRHLGWDIGAHYRGLVITELFEEKKGDIGDRPWEWLSIDHGLYLKNQGLLDDARGKFSHVVAQESSSADIDYSTLALALQNLSAVEVLRGYIPESLTSAKKAFEYAARTTKDHLMEDCRVRLATSHALLGNIKDADELFRGVKPLLTRSRMKKRPRETPGIRYGWFLLHIGQFHDARILLEETLELSKYFKFGIISARTQIVLAEVLYRLGDFDQAKDVCDQVFSWAFKAGDQEMIVAAHHISAVIALTENKLSDAVAHQKDGIRLAEECGYSIYWIDLKIARGRVDFVRRKYDDAIENVRQALNGVDETKKGYPIILGAKNKLCNYVWGEGDALNLLGEVYLRLQDKKSSLSYLLRAKEIRFKALDPKIHETEGLIRKLKNEHSN